MLHETTISRILAKVIGPAQMERVVHAYFDGQVQVSQAEVIAIERTLTASLMLKDYLDWPYLQQVFKLNLERLHLATGPDARRRFSAHPLEAFQLIFSNLSPTLH